MNKIVEMKFGSHLYGTNTENSDVDIKGIFLPEKRDILLCRVPKSLTFNTKTNSEVKNTCDDQDVEFYSLHYFLKLACDGETVALDMIHANKENIISSSIWWKYIQLDRSKFYTKSLKSFVGYCRKQAAKYGVKGSRLNAAENVIKYLKQFDQDLILRFCWDTLPLNEYCYKKFNDISSLNEYEVCGKKFQETVRIGYVVPILEKFFESYGHRSKLAANNEGLDWKAISHALRAAYQTKSILTEGDIVFPLKEAEYLKKVKNGECDFLSEVSPKLDELMLEVEELSNKSTLPEKVDRKYWDDFLVHVIQMEYLK